MVDLRTEEILSLQQAAEHAQVSSPTVWRWALKGLPGADGQRVRLRAARLGGRWITSIEALQEFCESTTPKLGDDVITPLRTPDKRMRASQRAAKQLEKVGI